MLEKQIENRLRKEVEKRGGLSIKFTSPAMAGVPDRLVVFPKSRLAFVELKAPGKGLRPLQLKRKTQLENLGLKVYVIDSYEKVDLFLKEMVE